MKRRGFVHGAACAALGAAAPVCAAAADSVTVFAAASLADAFAALAAARVGRSPKLRFSFAASSTLARQIEQGAPADVFVSADEDWMDYLVARRKIVAASRRDVVANRLVVVRADAAGLADPPESTAALRSALAPHAGLSRIASGDPAHVPAGRYAQAALTRLGLWADVEPRLVRADSVRSALAFVERGEAAAGIVYATDARVGRGTGAVARFPVSSHPPIRYPAALVEGAGAAAPGALAELFTREAQSVFAAAGFGAP